MYIPTIPLVLDTLVSHDVPTNYLHEHFAQHEISHIRKENALEKRYVCYLCRHPVKLQARKNEDIPGGHRYYFCHPSDVECEWKTIGQSKAEVYRGVQEGKKHREMKELLEKTLKRLPDWCNTGSDDKFFWDVNHVERRKPDVYSNYLGSSVVFEIQLRSEDPQVITARQNFYLNERHKLIWFSVENTELVGEDYRSDCIDVKQVQKDIAYSNNGNWYIFNTSLAEKSIDDNQLTFLVKYYWPELTETRIEFDWREALITFEDVSFVDGKMIYRDCLAEYERLRRQLLADAQSRILNHIAKNKFHNWSSFLTLVKQVWPNLSILEDSEWLNDIYTQTLNERLLKLKAQIVNLFSKKIDNETVSRWNKIAAATADMELGIKKDAALHIVEKLLLVLGFPLRPGLNGCRTCHDFHDYESFHPYFDLYMEARKASWIADRIESNPKIVKRREDVPVGIEQNTELNLFLGWFISEPKLAIV